MDVLILIFLGSLKTNQIVQATSSMMFEATRNISGYEFARHTEKSIPATSVLECAGKCLYWQNQSNYCNTFRWKKSNIT